MDASTEALYAPDIAPELSDVDSEGSAESISGDIVRPWDDNGVREERYRHVRDTAVQFSEEWKPLDLTRKGWEAQLKKFGAFDPTPQKEPELKKAWKIDGSGNLTMT